MSLSNHGRVLFTATLVRGHIAKFHIPYLKWFKEQGWETWVAAKNDYPDGVCEIPHCDHYVNIDFARSPFSKQTLVAYRQLRRLFSEEHFDIVHTHTPVGSVLTRLAARDARHAGTKDVYTAHGFHFYKGAPAVNWALWYPVERLMSRFTDVLVTINDEDYRRAQQFAHCRVEYVPGVGIDLERFSCVRDRAGKRAELGLADGDFALLSVGDLIPRKNQAVIVGALSLLPENVKLLICGEGVERGNLEEQIAQLGLQGRARLLGFRPDMAEVMHACDALVFPSVHEGLPVSVMEAMASGLPVVASSIRGIDPDLLKDHESGLVLESVDPGHIAAAVAELMGDASLRGELAANAAKTVERFGLEDALAATSQIYAGGGCSMLTRTKLGLVPGDVALLSVGDLNENKNHGILVEALAMLPANYRLFIAGEGPLRGALEEKSRELGVADRVELLGFRKDVASLLNACDLFCFPSRREGLPVSLIEAMACGTPCLASDARGCADVLGPLACGSIVAGDVCAWADAITKATVDCRDPSVWRTQAEKFDVGTVVDRMATVYA